MRRRAKRAAWIVCGLVALVAGAARPLGADPVPAQDPADEALIEEALAEAEKERRLGEIASALRSAQELLAERPDDARACLLAARCRRDLAQYSQALEQGVRALDAARKARPALLPEALRFQAGLLLLLGKPGEAATLLAPERLDPGHDARDAWILGSLASERGEREQARRWLRQGAETPDGQPWDGLLDRARCQRKLGGLSEASESLVAADELARRGGSSEPDVLAELAEVYFEADQEVAEGERRSAGKLYEEALRLHKTHEAATLGQYELYRFNWLRRRKVAAQILGDYLHLRPDSIPALARAASGELDDGNLKSVRARLEKLERLAPQRRDVRALRAALAWVEHRREEAQGLLAKLRQEDPGDPAPERELAAHLCDLYRFAEAVPFAKAATERDPADHASWNVLGKALANSGDETAALAALDKAQELAAPRQDAWRDNTRKVLKRMQRDFARSSSGELGFAWDPRAAEIFGTYLVPFYAAARAELAERYGYTPGPTAIEVFGRHADFSVRSTGFEGYPALGVCFGPVVTAVSPLAEMRGSFSWARTSFHEFTHVIHLGLSHNRCPRWITEGIATWEETNRNPAWSRNMRRELVDALANDELIPARELNAAFRTSRILFAYYQGGLLCEMWVASHGFPALVHLLEAFDRGLDLDQAFAEVLHQTPEEVDRAFRARVEQLTRDLKIEPRWNPARLTRLRLGLAEQAPASADALGRWCEDWITLAAGAWQQGRRVDAEEALRHLGEAREREHPRASFLRGELALAAGDDEAAVGHYRAGFAAGGEDFRARIALANLLQRAEEPDEALLEAEAAAKAFPGFPEKELNAERLIGALHTARGDTDGAMQAIERWLEWESGDYDACLAAAAWHMEKGRPERAAARLETANEIDPFRRKLHELWGEALVACQRWEEAGREFRVGQQVPHELDADKPGEPDEAERARWLAREAQCLRELGRNAEARAKAEKALELDPGSELANEVLGKLP